MDPAINEDQLATLRACSRGELGTRQTIEQLGMRDYADLIIAMAQTDLDFPKPEDTTRHREQVARAHAILQPLLRRHD